MKLYLFGASGSGVTTLGLALAQHLKTPYFDSDHYFWAPSDPPFTVRRDPELRNQMIRQDLLDAGDWILGGSILNWGENVFPAFDLMVFLWIPPEIRLERLKKRELQRYGDVILTDPVRIALFDEFMRWAADYDQETGIANRTVSAHKAWLHQATVPTMEISGDFSVEERMQEVLAFLNLLTESNNY